MDVPKLFELEGIFGNIVAVLISLAGIVFFLMLVLGGFKWITAGGEPPAIESARKTITAAMGGLIFIALSFLFLRLFSTFTGVDLTKFTIYQPPL